MKFEYLDFINARDQINHRYEIDSKSCALLRVIFQASPVTLHQGIKHLMAKKLIAAKSDPKDGRLKYLVPTNKAIKLYGELSALVVRGQAKVIA